MITIPREALSIATQAAATVAQSSHMPATDIAFISAAGGYLVIQATDGSNWQETRTACDGELDHLQVNAAKISEIVKGMRGDTLKLESKDGFLLISAKGGGKRKLATDKQVYPEPTKPDGEPIVFETDRLRVCLDFAAPSMSDDSATKPQFCGVHLHSEAGKHRAAAYSGTSIASIVIGDASQDVALTLAARTLTLLKHIPAGSQVEMRVGDRLVSFTWDGGCIVAKQIDGAFVPYLNRVPTHDAHLTIRPSEMVAGIRSILAVGADESASKSKRIELRLGERVVVATQSQQGQAVEPLDAAWSGTDMVMSFASKRLEDAVRGFGDDELTIGITALPKDISQMKFVTVRSDASPDKLCMLTPLRG